MLMEFDAYYIFSGVFCRQYFHEDVCPLIKLPIDEKKREQFAWNDLVKKSTKAIVKPIYKSSTANT